MNKIGLKENLYKNALQNAKNESDIHSFLKKNNRLVINTFATSWNYAEAFPEVSLGTEYRIDFLVLCANSGFWTAHIIELKSPTESLYTKAGDKTKNLRLVERQITERNEWIQKNVAYFRNCLSNLVSNEDPGAQCSNVDDHITAKSELKDLSTHVDVQFHMVIGRASSLSKIERERRSSEARMKTWGSPEVITYDRFISTARRLDN